MTKARDSARAAIEQPRGWASLWPLLARQSLRQQLRPARILHRRLRNPGLLAAENKFSKEVDHRQRTIYSIFDYSARDLDDDLRGLLSKLWLFHTPFLPSLAVTIFDPQHDTESGTRSPVEDRLHALWQRGLLSREETGTLLLYSVQPVMRPYIERYLANAGERESLLARFGSAYASFARYLYDELDRGGLAAFLATLCRADLDRGLAYVTGSELGYYQLRWGWALQRLGYRKEGLALTEQALEYAQEQDSGLMLQAMNNMAIVYQQTGQIYQALRLNEQALGIRREVGDRSGEGTTLNNLGGVHSALGQKGKALEYYEQALGIRREVGDRSGEGTTLNNLGRVYDALGQKGKALEYYEQALGIVREVGDRSGEGTTLNNLGGVYDALGQKAKALEYYEQALGIVREVGDRAGEGTTLNNLGRMYDALGQKAKALEYYEQALGILREVGDRSGEGATLNNLGGVYNALGQKGKALEYYEQALGIVREVGNRAGEGATLNNLGGVYNALGQKAKALECYEQALGIVREVGDRSGEGTTLNNLGGVYDDLGQKGKALEYYEQALGIRREVGDRAGEGVTLFNLGMIYAVPGQISVSLACVLLAKTLFEFVQNPSYLDVAVRRIMSLQEQLGEDQFNDLIRQVAGREAEIVQQGLRDGLPPASQAGSDLTMPAKRVAVIVSNTAAVMTVMPERRGEWRETIQKNVENARQQGDDWQIEVEFFTAILALLDGQAAELSGEHPYAVALEQIRQGIANGGPRDDEEGEDDQDDQDDVPEEVQALLALAEASITALRGGPPERMTLLQQLAPLQAQTPDEGFKALLQTIQLSLVGGDLAKLGSNLEGLYQQVWEAIVAGVTNVGS